MAWMMVLNSVDRTAGNLDLLMAEETASWMVDSMALTMVEKMVVYSASSTVEKMAVSMALQSAIE